MDANQQVDSHDDDTNTATSGDAIPQWRLNEVIAERDSARSKVDELQTSLAAAPKEQEQVEKVWSRQELDAAVANGQITQYDADSLEKKQDRKATVDEAVAASEQRFNQLQSGSKQEIIFGQYREKHPNAFIQGTEESNRVRTEYNSMIELGASVSTATEIAALKVVLGSPDVKVNGETQHFQGASSSDNVISQKADGPPQNLTQRQLDYYSQHVGPGKSYETWKAVEEELEYATPNLAARHQAMYGTS